MLAGVKKIAVVAPAGYIAPEVLGRALLAWHHAGIETRLMPGVDAGGAASYLSAPAEVRAADFEAAWLDPSVDAVWCARGGFGSAQILSLLDWEALKSRPGMPVIGYSDITALHMAMLARGTGVPVTGAMSGKIDMALAEPVAECRLERVAGPPEEVAGLPLLLNLAVSVTLAGTCWWPDFRDRILVLEDVNEPEYKIDRYLTHLDMLGVFDQVRAVVLGEFLDCGEAWSVLEHFARGLAVPVYRGFPFGHEVVPATVRMDATMRLAGGGARWNLPHGGVR